MIFLQKADGKVIMGSDSLNKRMLVAGQGKSVLLWVFFFLLPFFAYLVAHPAGNCRLPMFVQTASPCVWNLHILRFGNPHKYGLFKGVVAKCTFCACFYVSFSSLSHAPKRPFHGQLRNCFTKLSRFRNGKKKGHKGD